MDFVRIMTKNREKTPFVAGLWVGIRAKIEKHTLCCSALVRKRANIEQNNILVGLWIKLGQKYRKAPFLARLLLE